MEPNQTCQVKGCSWPVVLCPEMCAPHWWKLARRTRDAINRAQIKGQKAGNHPSASYQGLINFAIVSLNVGQGNLAKYIHEDGDRDGRHSALTTCATCRRSTVSHSVIRGGDVLLVCDECTSMVPVVLPGSQRLSGMENL